MLEVGAQFPLSAPNYGSDPHGEGRACKVRFLGSNPDRASNKCYTDIHSLEETQEYWIRELGMSRKCMRKSLVNYYNQNRQSLYSQKKRKGKCEYGTCYLSVLKSVRIIQHIYGAIEWYSKNMTTSLKNVPLVK